MRKDSPPFRRVLIANRGEIAVRIGRACHELGIATVAVYSDADAGAPHVEAADRSVRIGPAAAAESYLRVDAIVEAAVMTDAQAVHPGYGFLSERAELAIACEAAGLVFIGPSPDTLTSLGDKLAARRQARDAGVPIVPGTFEALPEGASDDVETLEWLAREAGFPLLVKAAAGGGGRGMRRVDGPSELADAVLAARREAEQAFGDGSVYLERLVEGGRHIEVQLLGDGAGAVVALGERDCSVQRRHQKLVEEAPAPGLNDDQRRQLHDYGVRMAATVGLGNAATAEFLFSDDGQFFFLEVNARLQVEHGVTELVTGLDLVHEQLAIAAGVPLSAEVLAASRAAARPSRHAIEVRISAEDPSRDFAPTPGRVTRWREPAGPGIRMDSGVREGSTVSSAYDPLLAKLLVSAGDRERSLARLRRALDEFHVGGVQTTLPFHRWLVDDPAFIEARLRTDFVEQRWRPDAIHLAAAERAASAVAAAWSPETVTPSDDERTSESVDWRSTGRREAIERWPA